MNTTVILKPGNQLWGIYHTDREYARVMGDPLRTVVEAPTKLAAEEIVLRNPRHLVVRTSINGGISPSGNRSFNEQLRRALQQAGQGMKLFTDEFRSPIPAIETARAVWELTGKNCAGIYHVAGAERLSRWQIGQLLLSRWPEIKTPIESGSAKDCPGPPRALDTSLNIAKVQKCCRCRCPASANGWQPIPTSL